MRRVQRSVLSARAAAVVALVAVLFAGASSPESQAASTKQLQHVRGTTGYQTSATAADFKAIFGKFELPDEDFAVTRAGSAAVLAMPDSSLISLGENTTVQAGAFDNGAAGPGSTITLAGGSMRFEIQRPVGGAANYRFVTTTSNVAVRGTVGLISFLNGVTTVGCLACAADSVTVTVGTQTVALVTGQFLTVSATGVIATGAIGGVVGSFTAAGVPVTAQTGAIAAGLPAASVGASAGAITAAAAVAGAGIGIAASSHATAAPSNAPTANPTSTPTPTPTTTPSPSASPTQSGSVNLQGHPATAKPAEVVRPAAPAAPAIPAGRAIR